MSYSRWSYSCWYTFWTTNSGHTKETQVFEICDLARSMCFSYAELKNDIDACLKRVKDRYAETVTTGLFDKVVNNEFTYKDHVFPGIEVTDDQLEELKVYMKEFIKDVEETYND